MFSVFTRRRCLAHARARPPAYDTVCVCGPSRREPGTPAGQRGGRHTDADLICETVSHVQSFDRTISRVPGPLAVPSAESLHNDPPLRCCIVGEFGSTFPSYVFINATCVALIAPRVRTINNGFTPLSTRAVYKKTGQLWRFSLIVIGMAIGRISSPSIAFYLVNQDLGLFNNYICSDHIHTYVYTTVFVLLPCI